MYEYECLYATNDYYLHVQICDTGFDWTLYDKETLREIDGGILECNSEDFYYAVSEICELNGIDMHNIQIADIGILDEILEAQ